MTALEWRRPAARRDSPGVATRRGHARAATPTPLLAVLPRLQPTPSWSLTTAVRHAWTPAGAPLPPRAHGAALERTFDGTSAAGTHPGPAALASATARQDRRDGASAARTAVVDEERVPQALVPLRERRPSGVTPPAAELPRLVAAEVERQLQSAAPAGPPGRAAAPAAEAGRPVGADVEHLVATVVRRLDAMAREARFRAGHIR